MRPWAPDCGEPRSPNPQHCGRNTVKKIPGRQPRVPVSREAAPALSRGRKPMESSMEAFEAEFIKVGGWIGRQRPTAKALSLSEDPQAAYFPESSDTCATEPGGRVIKDKE